MKPVRANRDGWLDQSGLNLIRVVIGSYFCAIAMGVPMGFDKLMLISLVWPGEIGRMVASAALLAFAITFMLGFMLRAMSLILAMFLIVSSVAAMILGDGAVGLGGLWQSMAFGAAVMLCYGPLKPHEIHKAALISTVSVRGGAVRVMQKHVTPRRVRPKAKGGRKEQDPFARTFGPLIAPTDRMIGLRDANPRKDRARPEQPPLVEDDMSNIFVNL